MSDLLDRALPLIPNPQQIQLGARRWKPRRNWRFANGGADRWTFGDGKTAKVLLAGLVPPENDSPEAYALVAGPDGAAAIARQPTGLLRARATLRQLCTLAGDGAIPEVRIADWPDLAVRGVRVGKPGQVAVGGDFTDLEFVQVGTRANRQYFGGVVGIAHDATHSGMAVGPAGLY